MPGKLFCSTSFGPPRIVEKLWTMCANGSWPPGSPGGPTRILLGEVVR